MKIAISTTGKTLDTGFDPRFGRAAYFCIVDVDTRATTGHTNPALSAKGGAGVQAAKFIADQGVDAVISGSFGPNAFRTLQAANIATYLAPTKDALLAADLLEHYKAGQLQQANAPSHAGHHGGGH
ncbi:MAG: NifB/NifX family molybdenum-iron cluster-binding protein [Anaerolineales bacterium]|nr:NifB/NifX family molybdenum-iron cluster-binding protein [Anaerolineales bacterium]